MDNKIKDSDITTLAKVVSVGDANDPEHGYEIGELITFLYFEEEIKGDDGEELYVFINEDGLEQILHENEFEWINKESVEEG